MLDDALKYGSRYAKARFAVYLGDLGNDTAARACGILAKVPTPNNAVLLAVSPNQRAIEVVYGSEVQDRGIEESAPLHPKRASPSRRGDGLPVARARIRDEAITGHGGGVVVAGTYGGSAEVAGDDGGVVVAREGVGEARYELICNVAGHYWTGMYTELDVSPPPK